MKHFSLFLLLTILFATSSYGQWKHDYFMDARGSKTNNAYLIATYNATFSNSVTANAPMVASVLVSGSTDNYTVTFKMSKNDLTPAVRLGVLKVSTPVGKIGRPHHGPHRHGARIDRQGRHIGDSLARPSGDRRADQ